ncbi:hypothetical protein AB1L05_04625 [Cytobacillus horneckiae]|uniref:hypothetical protein n=1 Tax=Cytobacillus horneckiae TaxID=549687 RepID=UPI0039A1A5A7
MDKFEQTESDYILFNPDTEEYYDTREEEYISEVFLVEDGNVVKQIAVEEFFDIPDEGIDDETVQDEFNLDEKGEITPLGPTWSHIYKESSNREARITGKRASKIHENPGPGANTFSIAYNYTYTHTANISLNAL